MKTCMSMCVAAMLILLPMVGLANSPAPYWACEGKAVGDDCDPYGGGKGVCELDATCEDDPDTEIDECLYCDKLPGSGGCSTAGASAGALGLLACGLLLLKRRSG